VTTKTLTADAQRYDRRKLPRLQYNETMSKWLVSVAVTAALVTGCSFGNSAQTCSSDQQCQSGTSPGGRCELGFSLCSFADTGCPSGRRFGGLSGDRSGDCVGGSAPIADAAIDAPIDAAIDAPPDAQACFGTAPFTICLRNSPGPAVLFSGITSIDTTVSPMCVATVSGGDGYCVIAATSITVAAGIRVQVIGAKPLVLLASDSITTGTISRIDVGSHRATQTAGEIVGAGADPTLCDAGTGPTTANGTSGGGAGGSFIGPGGKGGTGSSTVPGAGGTAGANATAPVTTLRGGCAAQAGAGATSAAAGHGGGAVMLIAGSNITVNGDIFASGEGGGGGQPGFTGGGGGGAGGMIVLDAPFITASGKIVANGGGGGEGGNQNETGAPGIDPSDETAANGGGAIGNAGNGGTGAGGTASATAGGNGSGGNVNGGGGGGGGGGTGLLKAPATAVLGNQVSPPPTR
jgi:hypothetical protein